MFWNTLYELFTLQSVLLLLKKKNLNPEAVFFIIYDTELKFAFWTLSLFNLIIRPLNEL